MSGNTPINYEQLCGLRVNFNDVKKLKCQDEDTRFSKFDNAIRLQNDVVICFNNAKDDSQNRGTVLIEDGQVNIYEGMGLSIYGSVKADNIQLINSRNCRVDIKKGGKDIVKLNNRQGFGGNVVHQSQGDETKLIPGSKKPSKHLTKKKVYKAGQKEEVDRQKEAKISSARFWFSSKTIKGAGTIKEKDY